MVVVNVVVVVAAAAAGDRWRIRKARQRRQPKKRSQEAITLITCTQHSGGGVVASASASASAPASVGAFSRPCHWLVFGRRARRVRERTGFGWRWCKIAMVAHYRQIKISGTQIPSRVVLPNSGIDWLVMLALSCLIVRPSRNGTRSDQMRRLGMDGWMDCVGAAARWSP